MTFNGWLQIIVFFTAILMIAKPVGVYMFRVFEADTQPLPRVLGPIERGLLRLCGLKAPKEQTWVEYTVAMLVFSAMGLVVTYLIQRTQSSLPFNPQKIAGVPGALAFNTAASFTTNTNWQSYVPETTMSYLTQMAALTVHNFLSAATGIALAIALVRGFARRSAQTIGNFWVDLTRCVLYILLPISIVVGLVLIWQGTPQNLLPYTDVATLDGGKQLIAQGPVASQ
jgi:potassium-transporting ATPase potassium-binding subunit